MARGFVGGLLIGGAVAFGGAALLSVVAFPPSEPPQVQAGLPPGAGAVPVPPRETAAPAAPEASAAAVPGAQAPAADPVRTAPAAMPAPADPDMSRPGAAPSPQAAQSAGAAPSAPLERAAPAGAAPDALPEQARAQAAAPAVPQPGAALPLDTASPSPAQVSARAPELVPQTVPAPDGPPGRDAQAAPDQRARPSGTPRPAAAPPDPLAPDLPAQVTEPAQPQAQPQSEPQAQPQAEPQTAQEPPRAGLPTVTAQAQQGSTQTEAALAPRVGRPATSLIARAPQTAAEAPAQPAARPDSAADLPALEAHAVPHEAAGAGALMGIILMDQGARLGEDEIGVAALSSFPYPLSFAVDASLPDATERMAAYRAQGFEVLALVDLPEALTGADTEVSLAAALDAVPEAVAVLEGPGTGLQGGRALSDQVSAILRDTGHGIVWQPKGLDTAQKLAQRDGVASQTLFRDFDSAGQSQTVIRRFLDQAAFRAGQQGSVIMVGRVRGETISALLVWGLQDRASRVAVVPISAVLRAGQGG